MPFHNTGAVDVQGGTLGLDAGGTQSSDFAVASGATLRLSGTHTLSAASDITGAGGLSVAGGTITDAGTVNLGGTGTFSGGTATFTGSAFAVGVLAITGGTANLSASTPVSFSSGTLSSGALGGASDVTCTGLLLWSGGAMSGSGKTIIGGTGTLNLSTSTHDLNRVLQNDGTATWTAGLLQMSGGTFNNHGSFTANSSAALDCYGTGGVNAFNNAGTFTKQGAGVTRFYFYINGVPFHNTGAVDVQGGTLTFDAGFSQTAGSTMLSGGNISSSSTLAIQGGTFGGVGTVTANVTSSGLVSPGASPGVLTITGNYTEGTNAHLQIELGGPTPGAGHDQLSVGGTATLAGTLELSFWNGFTPSPGNVFTVLVSTARSGTFSAIQTPTIPLGVLYSPKNVLVEPENASPLVQLTVDSDWLACHAFRLEASATDPDGVVTNLTLLMGTNVLGTFPNGASRMITLGYDFPGEMTITAQATDNNGAMGATNVTGTVSTRPLLVLDPIGLQTNRAFKLCMAGATGTNYQMLASDDLAKTNWTALGTMQNTNGIWRYSDTTATNSAHRYYRARQVP